MLSGHPLKSDIANVVSWMLNEEFTSAYSSKSRAVFFFLLRIQANLYCRLSEIRDLQTFKGLALQDILTEIHLYVHKSKCQLMKIINNICYKIMVVYS